MTEEIKPTTQKVKYGYKAGYSVCSDGKVLWSNWYPVVFQNLEDAETESKFLVDDVKRSNMVLR